MVSVRALAFLYVVETSFNSDSACLTDSSLMAGAAVAAAGAGDAAAGAGLVPVSCAHTVEQIAASRTVVDANFIWFQVLREVNDPRSSWVKKGHNCRPAGEIRPTHVENPPARVDIPLGTPFALAAGEIAPVVERLDESRPVRFPRAVARQTRAQACEGAARA